MATRDRVARTTEVASGATAAGVGTMLGAAKLRDEYKLEHPGKFATHAAKAEAHAAGLGPKAGRFARLVSEGRPGFKPLAVGAGAAATATWAKRYRKHRAEHAMKHAHPEAPDFIAKSAFGVDHGECDIAKGLLRRKRGNDALKVVGDATSSVTAIRHKIVPSGLDIVRIADDKGRQAVARSGIGKANRKERAAEVGLGGGAVGATVGAIHHGRLARNHGIEAVRHAGLRERAFTQADAGTDRVRTQARQHAGNRAHARGKGITTSAMNTLRDDAQQAQQNLRGGRAAHGRSLHSVAEAGSAFRRARNYGAAGVGLGAGALILHRRNSTDH